MDVDDISFARPEVQTCPFDAYKALFEAHKRVHLDPLTSFWEIIGYDDLMAVVQNPSRYSSEHMLYGEKTHAPAYEEMKRMYEERGFPAVPTLINADEPVHKRNRDLVDVSFKASRVKAREPYIRDLVNQLIDSWGDASEIEYMKNFAELLPLYVIADTIGVPRARALDFKRWSDALIQVHDPSMTKEQQIELTEVILEKQQFFAQAFEAAQADPKDDILGDLVRGTVGGVPVTKRLAVHILSGLLVAGNETTTSVLGSAMKRLISTPGMEDRLRSHSRLYRGGAAARVSPPLPIPP
jgi:cytochrome P450